MPNDFTFHDLETAPEKSKPLLKKLLEQSGPNGFYAAIAESPEALNGYHALHKAFSASSFSNEEKTVIWQCINVENECHYCVPAHTAMAKAMKVSDEVTRALRDETALPNPKLEALRDFTLILVRTHGNASDAQVTSFLVAGYTHKNILELILAIAQKTISNYVNHLTKTPVDNQYEKYAWSKVQQPKA